MRCAWRRSRFRPGPIDQLPQRVPVTRAMRRHMADRAADGFYNDFLSPLAFPGLRFAQDLAKIGTPEAVALRARQLEGEFDGHSRGGRGLEATRGSASKGFLEVPAYGPRKSRERLVH